MRYIYFINSGKQEIPSEFLDRYRVNFIINNYHIYISMDVKNNNEFNFWGTKLCNEGGKIEIIDLSDCEARNFVIDAYKKGDFQKEKFDSHIIDVVESAIKAITKYEYEHVPSQKLH